MEIVKMIDVLNKLVGINDDRSEGYYAASKEIEEQDLEKMFVQFAQTSQRCSQDLLNEIYKLGGNPKETNGNSGKFFRTWMDVNYAITANDRTAILDSCEYGEDHAIESYEKVLREELDSLNIDQLTLINSQYTLIKNDQFRLISIRESMVV